MLGTLYDSQFLDIGCLEFAYEVLPPCCLYTQLEPSQVAYLQPDRTLLRDRLRGTMLPAESFLLPKMNKRHRVGEHVLAIRLPTPPTFYCVRYSYGKRAEDYPVVHYLGAFMFQLFENESRTGR